MLNFEITTFNQSGIKHEAVFVAWADIEELLGHPHSGEPDDDNQIVDALIKADALWWLNTYTEGSIDERGWYLIGTEIVEDDFNLDEMIRYQREYDNRCSYELRKQRYSRQSGEWFERLGIFKTYDEASAALNVKYREGPLGTWNENLELVIVKIWP